MKKKQLFHLVVDGYFEADSIDDAFMLLGRRFIAVAQSGLDARTILDRGTIDITPTSLYKEAILKREA